MCLFLFVFEKGVFCKQFDTKEKKNRKRKKVIFFLSHPFLLNISAAFRTSEH